MSVDLGLRGQTTIADRVVSKIAARAAAEVEQTAGAGRQVFGITVGRPARTAPPRTEVRIDGNVALVQVTMSVAWPASVRQVAQQVRQRVTEQVRALTGMTVAEVEVRVTALAGASGGDNGRVV